MSRLAKIAPAWQGRPILDAKDHNDLEQRSAIHEFQGKMDRVAAEDRAHGDYRREHHLAGAAHHLQGMRAAQATGHLDEGKKHGAMYALHLKELGHDPYGEPPAEISQRASAEDRDRVYRFKPHKSDLFLLDTKPEPSMQKSESCPKCKKDSMHVVLGRRECRNCDTERKARRAMEGAARSPSARREAEATLKTKKSETVYRDLKADTDMEHHGKPCDHCGKKIHFGSYSLTDGKKYCSKPCYMKDDTRPYTNHYEKSEQEPTMADNEQTHEQKLRKFWDEKHAQSDKQAQQQETMSILYKAAKAVVDIKKAEEAGVPLAKYISPAVKYGPSRPKHPAPPATVPEPKEEKKSELLEGAPEAAEKSEPTIGGAPVPKEPITAKGEIKDKDGETVTCGKCAAFGTNSKGPGAHAPGCKNDTKKSEPKSIYERAAMKKSNREAMGKHFSTAYTPGFVFEKK